jgi:diguanylate cyclase (GGDEF)-like protein/PAS domain S-box-containing protein
MPESNEVQFGEALRAVQGGDIDALMIDGAAGGQLFILRGTDLAYRVLVEEMGEGALTLAPDGVVAYSNQKFASLLGLPLQTVIGATVLQWVAPEARAQLSALLAEALFNPCSAEFELVAAGQERVPVLVSLSPLHVNGLADAVCMIATDLTRQKRGAAAMLARANMAQMIAAHRHSEEMLEESITTLQLHDSALAVITQGVVISDPQQRIVYINRAFESISGYSQSELLGVNCKLLQGPQSDPATVARIRESLASGKNFRGDILNYRKDGRAFWNDLSITSVLDMHGTLTHFVGVQNDVTARHQSEEERVLGVQVFEQSTEGFIITDAAQKIITVNAAFSAISGFSATEVIGQPLAMLNTDRHDADFARAKWAEVEHRGQWEGETTKRRKDGSSYPQWLSLRRLSDAAGNTTHYVASFSDITERKLTADRIRRLAYYDSLTGLPNRMLLEERTSYAMKLARRNKTSLALVFFDIDHFKKINDSLGHRIGDLLLVALATRMQSALRDQDCLARLGGDEFILILPDTNAEGALRVAQKLLQLAQPSYTLENHELSISVSMGCAIFPSDADEFETLASCADSAMYRAKHSGRNKVCFHTAEIQAQISRVMALENGLRKALALGQMQLHYQPQQNLATGRIIGAEALLRWTHPELGAVSPAEFIPIAESSGLIASLGHWVLANAAAQLKTWLDRGMAPISMAINLSATQFRQPDLPERIRVVLETSGLDAHHLDLELTESVALDDPIGAIDTMQTLHALGVKMSIDDFGTGYSSLSYLKRFRINKIKIDQSFLRNLVDHSEDQAIVRAIIAMANSLGLRTIAEGVETEAQMRYLSAHGCDEIQGYWLGRPMPPAQFEAFMLEHCA